MEFRAQDVHGAWRWFEVHASGLRNEEGRVTYMAGTAFDITDRKALEEAQRQTLAQLETVANASPVLFWMSGIDKRCEWINQRWLDLHGTRLEDELGDGWRSTIHPDDVERCMRDYEQAFK
ncbi:PAS domain-containing protein, partial [Arthrospira platensis SPKY1]|nr:PAS domain-containing protein [Arthrospira platensis SPKY1]